MISHFDIDEIITNNPPITFSSPRKNKRRREYALKIITIFYNNI